MKKNLLLLSLAFVACTVTTNNPTVESSVLFFQPLEQSGPVPWSQKAFQNSSDQFQFVIVSDRTGGMRNGVFKETIAKINRLHPEFVMSVGDLIDGYTENDSLIESQWSEFEGIIDQLEVPFFHIPGNHDITNERMAQAWKELHGPSYYHFLYKDILFLCLNTDDPPASQMSDAQITYFKEVLDTNKDVPHILIFMHKPLWDYDEATGFDKFEALLAGHSYTVFSGHYHSYNKHMRLGQNYYTLGTTGGGSMLRGAEFGELDHILWVTMSAVGPDVAVLTTDGNLPDDIVDGKTYPLIQTLRWENWFSIRPLILPSARFQSAQTAIDLANPSEQPLTISGQLVADNGLTFQPEAINLHLAAGRDTSLSIQINSAEVTDLNTMEPITFSLMGRYEPENKPALELPRDQKLSLDWRHPLSKVPTDFKLDATLTEWGDLQWESCTNPAHIKEDWTWHGAEDGSFKFKVANDESRIYIALDITDDKLLFDPLLLKEQQDKVIVLWDVREEAIRDTAECSWENRGEDYALLVFAPGEHPLSPLVDKEIAPFPADVNIACQSTPSGLSAEITIPYEEEVDRHSVRINIAYMDHDIANNIKPTVFWWRPPWFYDTNYIGSGTFYQDSHSGGGE